jgi:hypothetical protein
MAQDSRWYAGGDDKPAGGDRDGSVSSDGINETFAIDDTGELRISPRLPPGKRKLQSLMDVSAPTRHLFWLQCADDWRVVTYPLPIQYAGHGTCTAGAEPLPPLTHQTLQSHSIGLPATGLSCPRLCPS